MDASQLIQVDQTLVACLAVATRDGLSMASVKPVPVGVTKYVSTDREVSAIVGFVGSHSGSIMINASRTISCHLSGKMLGETYDDICPEVLDGMSEIANIIAGKAKAILSTTDYQFDRISCPSVVVGSNYAVSHYKGMMSLGVTFEIPEMPLTILHNRFFSVSLSIMKV